MTVGNFAGQFYCRRDRFSLHLYRQKFLNLINFLGRFSGELNVVFAAITRPQPGSRIRAGFFTAM
jgi:hypothetical protein